MSTRPLSLNKARVAKLVKATAEPQTDNQLLNLYRNIEYVLSIAETGNEELVKSGRPYAEIRCSDDKGIFQVCIKSGGRLLERDLRMSSADITELVGQPPNHIKGTNNFWYPEIDLSSSYWNRLEKKILSKSKS